MSSAMLYPGPMVFLGHRQTKMNKELALSETVEQSRPLGQYRRNKVL